MNERIKELAEQAGDDWDHTLKQDREFLKKFAELIINECGVALKPMLRDTISRGESVVLIREHFGVVK